MEDEVADARRTFIAVTVLCGVLFGLPFLYLACTMAQYPWADHMDLFGYGAKTEAYAFGIAMTIPSLVAYLNWADKRRKLETPVDRLAKPRSAIELPLKAETPARNVYTREPLISPAKIQEGLHFLNGFLLKLLNHIRQVMK